jgi:hypothetical protein
MNGARAFAVSSQPESALVKFGTMSAGRQGIYPACRAMCATATQVRSDAGVIASAEHVLTFDSGTVHFPPGPP